MYYAFRDGFPSCHAVFVYIVLSASFRVTLATSLDKLNHNTDIDVESGTVWNDNDKGELAECNGTENNNQLHRKENVCFQYFLALIRLRSQKQLPHWSMLSPLGHHCKGYLQPGHKNPLIGAGCNIKTAWHKLDDIFKICTPALMALVKSQLAITCVFDNWQRLINKLWQDLEKSSLYQRGTAFFVKQDKAFVLPVGTIMLSPLGLKFCVVSCIAIDAYTSVVISELAPFPFNICDSDMYNDVLS